MGGCSSDSNDNGGFVGGGGTPTGLADGAYDRFSGQGQSAVQVKGTQALLCDWGNSPGLYPGTYDPVLNEFQFNVPGFGAVTYEVSGNSTQFTLFVQGANTGSYAPASSWTAATTGSATGPEPTGMCGAGL